MNYEKKTLCTTGDKGCSVKSTKPYSGWQPSKKRWRAELQMAK